MNLLLDILISLLLLSGCFFIVVGGVGVCRLPDIYCRAHAMAKAMTFGIGLLLVGAWLHIGVQEAGLKIVLALVFQFSTIPVAGHLLSLVGYKTDVPRWRSKPIDDRRTRDKNSFEI